MQKSSRLSTCRLVCVRFDAEKLGRVGGTAFDLRDSRASIFALHLPSPLKWID